MLGPVADVPGERDRAVASIDHDIAVVRDYRAPVERVLHQIGHVAASTSLNTSMSLMMPRTPVSPTMRVLGGVPLEPAPLHAGQPDVAVAGAGLGVVRHADRLGQGVVRCRGQHRVIPVTRGRQHHAQMVLHPGDAVHSGWQGRERPCTKEGRHPREGPGHRGHPRGRLNAGRQALRAGNGRQRSGRPLRILRRGRRA